jgi:hypothetical protein
VATLNHNNLHRRGSRCSFVSSSSSSSSSLNLVNRRGIICSSLAPNTIKLRGSVCASIAKHHCICPRLFAKNRQTSSHLPELLCATLPQARSHFPIVRQGSPGHNDKMAPGMSAIPSPPSPAHAPRPSAK